MTKYVCLLLAFLWCPIRVEAQSCLSADSLTQERIELLRSLLSRSDDAASRWRANHQLSPVPDSQITVVGEESACAAAASAFNAILPSEQQRVGRQVYLVRVGTSRFLVWEPRSAATTAEFTLLVVLDQFFAVLARSAG